MTRYVVAAVCSIALATAPAIADQRVAYDVFFGETDEELEQWGRGWVGSYFSGPVWADFDERDSVVYIVQFRFRFTCHDADYPKCALVAVPNPGWRGHKGDKAKVHWDEEGWKAGKPPHFKLVQLRTSMP